MSEFYFPATFHYDVGVPFIDGIYFCFVRHFFSFYWYGFHAEVPLYGGENDPTRDSPCFIADQRGAAIDVCALPMNNRVSPENVLDASFLDPKRHFHWVKLAIAQECFVVGYPEGLFVRESENMVLPIWKTGHIAAEPSVFVDGVPKFLIDASTRPGMSGSPVFVKGRSSNRLLGLYTGRTSETSELGYVFSPQLLIDMVGTKRESPGSVLVSQSLP